MLFRTRTLVWLVCLVYLDMVCFGEELNKRKPDLDEETQAKEQKLAETMRLTRRDIVERTYIVAYDGKEEGIKKLADENGYAYRGRIAGNFYELRDNNPVVRGTEDERASRSKEEEKRFAANDKLVKSFTPDHIANIELTNAPLRRVRRFTVNDNYWSHQWHLHPTHRPTMGVSNVWDLGYSGARVNVTMVDDGLDYTHVDLDGNYLAANSYNFISEIADPQHIGYMDSHGTNTAGIVAAERNSECIIGIAYNAKVAGATIISYYGDASDSQIARAMVYSLGNVDISSNSWGKRTSGSYLAELVPVMEAAFIEGTTQGRDGKGIVYVFAAGNGRTNYDDCNSNSNTRSIHTISVSSLAPSSELAYYSEECSAVLVGAYGGDSNEDTIATTDPGNNCITSFQGTSASCPVVAGIVALVLEANSNLTYRDVQHLFVEYARSDGLHSSHNFYTNGAGKNVSYHSGFGLPNAYAMVNAAPYWQTVPNNISCETTLSSPSLSSSNDILDTVVASCPVNYIENVILTLEYSCADRGDVEIYLLSPSGNVYSRVFKRRPYDNSNSRTTRKFKSVHFWGESSSGTWTIKLMNTGSYTMYLYSWKLTFYGTTTDPLAGQPADGFTGGRCDIQTPCNHTNDVCHDNICSRCEDGRSIINGECMKDGMLGGFCNETVLCESWKMIGCDLNTSTCASCNPGFHGIGGFCILDGIQGGFCDEYSDCSDESNGCDPSNNTCIHCGVGYHVIDGFCMEDGMLGGFCNTSNDCENGSVCSTGLVCTVCGNGFHAINGYCVQDGTIGGYCNFTTPCSTTGSGCSASTDRCIMCPSGYRIQLGYCISTVCGGVYPAVTTTINSPNYPDNYPNDRDCQYIIVAPHGNITLYFTSFSLEDSSNCMNDSVKVFDGSSTQVLGTYCGSFDNTFSINSSTNVMILVFSTNTLTTRAGFQATSYTNWHPSCGGIFYHSQGELTSPNHPNLYPSLSNCTWYIYTSDDYIIQLTFDDFNLQSDYGCDSYDYVVVYDGHTKSEDKELLRHCGRNIPNPVYSTSSIMTVTFNSNSYSSYTGFSSTYMSIQMTPGCGGIYDDANGTLTSPNYPNSYPSGINCYYYIPQSPGLQTQIIFKTFSVGSTSDQCSGSYVEIFEVYYGATVVLERLCGLSVPSVIAASNNIQVRFVSVDNVANQTGFELEFARTCSYDMTELSGIVSSPNYPNNYPLGVNCTWNIEVPPGNIIDLNIHSFNIYDSSSDCIYDYLMVYEGTNVYGRFCGSSVRPRILSSNNTLTFTMVTGDRYSRAGFNASYLAFNATTQCGGDVYIENGTIRSPGYPANHLDDTICVWRFVAPPDYIISFMINTMSSVRYTCDSFVKIYDNSYTANEDLIRTFCYRSTSYPSISSSNNTLTVKYVARNNDYDSFGFEGSFRYFRKPGTIGAFCNYTTPCTIDGSGCDASRSICIHCPSEYMVDSGYCISSECGGVLHAIQGSISSPNYPNYYTNNASCAFIIVAPEGNIRLSFSTFDLENSPSCAHDSVIVLDGSSTRMIGTFCGYRNSFSVTSTTNVMAVIFTSDVNNTATGFNATYSILWSPVCGGILDQSYGQLASPNYPNNYPSRSYCTWYIFAIPGNTIQISFNDFRLESDSGCDSYDYVVVYDGHSKTESVELLRHCGGTIPADVNSTSNELTVYFKSDGSVTYSGFSASYISQSTIPGCGGLFDEDNGTLVSPNYPNPYPSNTECNYYITGKSGITTQITFNAFSVGNRTDECIGSYVEILEGNYDEPMVELDRVCGTFIPSAIESTKTIQLRFVSGDNELNQNGFEALYTKTCSQTLNATAGSIASPNYPGNYPPYVNCTWDIAVPEGYIIDLDIRQFNIYSYYSDCRNDYLRIYDGTHEYGRFCGSSVKPRVLSPNNTLTLKMVTGNRYQRTGFYASYVAIDTANLQCGGTVYSANGTIQSPGYPNHLPADAICTWHFIAPANQTIVLTIDTIVSNRYSCDSFVKIYNNSYAANKHLLTTYCYPGTSFDSVHSSSNVMTLKFVARNTSSISEFGFRASFRHFQRQSCSNGNSTGHDTGIITSPGYPSSYPNNINCGYLLQTYVGKRIVLNFTAFSLYYDSGCDDDYVAIYDGDTTAASNLIGKYCSAYTIPRQAVSSGNQMTVVFKSNYRYSRTGFMAMFHSIDTSADSCVGHSSSSYGQVHSPAYPSYYPPNALCITSLNAPVGYVIDLWFDSFRLYYDSGCDDDSVSVYDSLFTKEDDLLLRHCSTSTIPGYVTSTTNEMTILFVSNWRYERYGFNAYYYFRPGNVSIPSTTTAFTRTTSTPWWRSTQFPNSTTVASTQSPGTTFGITARPTTPPLLTLPTNTPLPVTGSCGGPLSGLEGSFASPGYPNGYSNNLHCTWDISVHSSYRINLTFESVSLEANKLCTFDWIEVYGGLSSANLIGRYCENVSNSILSSGNTLRVIFHSDGSQVNRGFLASFAIYSTSAEVHALTTSSGLILSPGFPANFPSDVNALWVINVEQGKVVDLNFIFFTLLGEPVTVKRSASDTDCPDGALSVYDGSDVQSTMLAKYCGDTKPPSTASSANEMSLWLKADNARPTNGFSLYYESEVADISPTGTNDASEDTTKLIIVASVLGLLIFCLLVAVIVLCVYMCKRKYKTDNDAREGHGNVSKNTKWKNSSKTPKGNTDTQNADTDPLQSEQVGERLRTVAVRGLPGTSAESESKQIHSGPTTESTPSANGSSFHPADPRHQHNYPPFPVRLPQYFQQPSRNQQTGVDVRPPVSPTSEHPPPTMRQNASALGLPPVGEPEAFVPSFAPGPQGNMVPMSCGYHPPIFTTLSTQATSGQINEEGEPEEGMKKKKKKKKKKKERKEKIPAEEGETNEGANIQDE